jgi:phosphoglycolate phosphatase-like HAD superfamily hydrolase
MDQLAGNLEAKPSFEAADKQRLSNRLFFFAMPLRIAAFILAFAGIAVYVGFTWLWDQTTLMHAVVFDIDGTLLQSASVDDSLYRLALVHVLGPIEFRETLADYEFVSDSGILSQVLIDNNLQSRPNPTPEIISKFLVELQIYIDRYGPFQEVPGARNFLASLTSSPDHYVAVATGGWSASAKLKLKSADFDLHDLTLSTSDEERDRTRIMCSALDRPEAEYESVTYYGDGPWDEEACALLGWNFVAVGPALGGLESYHGRDW